MPVWLPLNGLPEWVSNTIRIPISKNSTEIRRGVMVLWPTFSGSSWMILARKNSRKIFPALWMPVWLPLNGLPEWVSNTIRIPISKNSTEIRRGVMVLWPTFSGSSWMILARKNSRKIFPALWMPVWSPLNGLPEWVRYDAFTRLFSEE